ncbi:hypothetical protein ACFL3T_01695 [Patescibacteria group bacterium]
MRGIDSFNNHPLITGDLFTVRQPDSFNGEKVKLNIEVLDEATNKVWIELKGIKTEKTVSFAFVNTNPDLANFRECLILELDEMGIEVID